MIKANKFPDAGEVLTPACSGDRGSLPKGNNQNFCYYVAGAVNQEGHPVSKRVFPRHIYGGFGQGQE